MFKIDNIGPTDTTNLQKCLCCNGGGNGGTSGTGPTGPTGPSGSDYTGTGYFGPGFTGAGNQGDNAIAMGYYAASQGQGTSAIAIGSTAGQTSQGANSIAIGAGAGANNQAAGSIVINATGSPVNNTTTGSCVITPVRNVDNASTNIMFYDNVTGELTWGSITPSSIRFKENVTPLTDTSIDTVLKLKPVEFDFKKNGKHSFGLIAEDTNYILPQIVQYHPETGEIEGVEYIQLVAPLLKLVQQHEEKLKLYESILLKNGLLN